MYEEYRLVLRHTMMDKEDGSEHDIEPPLIIRMVYDRRMGLPATYCVNRMLQQMEDEMLRRMSNNGQL